LSNDTLAPSGKCTTKTTALAVADTSSRDNCTSSSSAAALADSSSSVGCVEKGGEEEWRGTTAAESKSGGDDAGGVPRQQHLRILKARVYEGVRSAAGPGMGFDGSGI
jgi:hypothetical protein